MSTDGMSPEDQTAVSEVARSVMRKLAAGQSAEDVARELCMTGLEKSSAQALVEHVQEDWRQIEAAPLANAGIYLHMKYPQMKPVGSGPTLQTVHGIGTCFYGSRDLDRATGSYVKTQCFCVLFLPLIALKSYRVVSRGSGWTLVGRVPLSGFAKGWNIAFLCAVLGCAAFAVIDETLNSRSSRAGRKLAQADEAAAAGDLLAAGRLYVEVAHTRTQHAAAARQRCAALIERPEIENLPLREVIQVFDDVIETRLFGGNRLPDVTRGLAIVEAHARTDTITSMKLLCRIASLSSTDACREFAKLMAGPLAALPPARTLAAFREAAGMHQENAEKADFVGIGIKQCRRLAASDLPAAFELLAILAPVGDRPAAEKCLAELLQGPPMDKARCADVVKIVGIAKAWAGPDGTKLLFQAGIAWVEHHPQTPHRELFKLLDKLAELPAADQARVAALRRPLLEKLVAANPQDVELAVQLALVLEAEDHFQDRKHGQQDGDGGGPGVRIVKLLSPLREKLGTGEGARLLGQALSAQGKFDDSYALLAPYLETGLNAYHEAQRELGEASRQAEIRIANQINNHSAPGIDYDAFERAPEDKKQAIFVEYFREHWKDDPAVQAAEESLARQTKVVPAALELGMVMLQRAQAMKDPAARRAELERAEKTFLAIRGRAAESDQYMLHLGQVYYWLGKQKEGHEDFEKLLENHGRNAEILYALAPILRDLGAIAEARKLTEEAYDKATNEEMRKEIAQLRAITSTGLDDEIHWLERCDADKWDVKALLAEARGSRAETHGKDDEAAADYREAVAIFEQQPQSVAVLNNGARASILLFEISGDRQAMARGTQWLEKAVSLSPMDSLVLGNAADQMLRAAIQDLAGTRLDLRKLQMSGQIGALYYMAADQKGVDEIRRRAREHSGLRKALNYLERAIVLAPKRVGNIEAALDIYGFLRDREALQRLAAQVAASKPDTEDATAKTLKYYHYQDEEFSKENGLAKIARAQALVTRLRTGEMGPAYAAARDRLVELKLAHTDDPAFNADETVRLAEDAHRAAPTMATYQPLIQALLQRAAQTLAAEFPEFAKAVHGTERAAPASYSVPLAIGRNDPLGKSARENRDVQRAVALIAARAEAFPETKSPEDWALLGVAGPSRADLRAKCLAPDELDDVERQIRQSVTPINPSDAFDVYWRRLAAGTPNAREPLDQLVKLGVPLPVSLIQSDAERK